MKHAVALLLVACGSAGPSSPPIDDTPDAARPVTPSPDAAPVDDVPYPDPDWPTGTPESQGLASDQLDAASRAAEADQSYCLLVIRHGVLVSEHYYGGTDAATTNKSWSIAKSYTSTTVGIALGNGDLPSLDLHASDYLTSWQGTPRAGITLENLVTMTSGLDWSVFSDYIEMAAFSPDNTAFAEGVSAKDAPNTTWVYNNSAVQVIEPVFRAAAGQSIEDYARAHLWTPIGMTGTTWAHDQAGHPTTYANVMATCRDHARLGYLYLHGGRWKHQQVVPADWVAAALAPSQPYNQGYGRLFWLNGHQPTMSSLMKSKDDVLYPYAPADLFAARGFGGQFIDVIPSLDMVVVRFGADALSSITDPTQLAAVLAQDELQDTHKQILQPILAAVTN